MADENCRLRLLIDQRESTNALLTRHVDSLTSELEHLRQRTAAGTHDNSHLTMATGSHDDDPHVQFVMEQMRQFRADFESEKRDRVAAEAQVNELRQQLAAANVQVKARNI